MAREAGAMMTQFDFQDASHIKDDKRKATKISSVQEAGELLQDEEILPENLRCQDCLCGLCFMLMLAFVFGIVALGLPALNKIYGNPDVMTTTLAPTAAVASARLLEGAAVQGSEIEAEEYDEDKATSFSFRHLDRKYLVTGVMGGCLAALVAVMALIYLCKSCAKCVVRTALVFSCVLLIIMGFVLIYAGSSYGPFAVFAYIGGALCIFLGLCGMCYWLCCASSLIEFTARVVEMTAVIALENSCMFVVSLIGCINTIVWNAISVVAFLGFAAYLKENVDLQQALTSSKYGTYGVFGVGAFCYFWGGFVIAAVCYTTYCGVFARWYFSGHERHAHKYESGVLMQSYLTAQVYNFGSICFGTGLLAFVRAMEFLARMAQNEASEDGISVTCLIACVVRCILDCIGDIIEFINEWGYVQCAIRNTSYCTSVKMVFGLIQWKNAMAIISTWAVDSVVNFGSFLAAVVAGLVGAGVGLMGNHETAFLAAIIAFCLGMMIGWNLWSIFTAGSKTLLTCWCEHPDTLFQKADESDEEYYGEDGHFLPSKIFDDFDKKSKGMETD